ncbi:MAG: phosphatidate cytidylyltransferase [Pirellulaceae bacterium]
MFDFRLLDQPTIILLLSNVTVLAVLFVVGRFLRKRSESEIDKDVVRAFSRNMLSWIIMCVVLALALMVNELFTVIFFWFVSFWAQREFITLTPTRPGDHRTLFWVILIFPILQYVLVGMAWYELYSILIPVYGVLFVAARIAFANDQEGYLERIAKIQFGLLICVYALSHAPALLTWEPWQKWDSEAGGLRPWTGAKGGLLLYLVVIVQFSDMVHFVVDRTFGKQVIAPRVHETKSWEGLIAAAFASAVVGVLIQLFLPVTPFQVIGSGVMALIISVMASSGSMTMWAIKRDRGIARQGTLVSNRGVLDQIASICFAAPIFFHVTRLFLGRPTTVPTEEANEPLQTYLWQITYWIC